MFYSSVQRAWEKLLMRNVAQLIGVPFVKADATKFSETGRRV